MKRRTVFASVDHLKVSNMLRDELTEMIGLAERLIAADEPAVLATLFSASGSTYRPLGSMMVSGPGSGFIAGGVSGGCLEEYIARKGRELLERYRATMLSFETDPDHSGDGLPSLGCGGSIEVLVERCTLEHLSFLHQFRSALAADGGASIACVIDASQLPSLSVQREWCAHNRGGFEDIQLERLRRRSIAERRSLHGELMDSRRALVHYIRPMTRLVLLGAGNDAVPLCKLARSLGWHVAVADRRARLANRTRFPDADQVVAGDWWTALGEITFTPQTAVVVMTHGIDDDIEILPLLAEKSAAYIGLLGPAHRRDWVLREVRSTHTLGEAFVGRLRGPIGLDLGERGAEGIAVSIIAEILAEMNERTAKPLSKMAPSAHRGLPPRMIVEHV